MEVINPGREYRTSDGQTIRFMSASQTGTTTEEIAEILAHRHTALVQEGNGWPRWHELLTCCRGLAYLLESRKRFLAAQKTS